MTNRQSIVNRQSSIVNSALLLLVIPLLAPHLASPPASAAPPPVSPQAAGTQTAGAPASAAMPDFEAYRARIEPIFLDKRPGHARCYVCHSQTTPWRIQRLDEGKTAYTLEQSRENFNSIERLVAPGRPLESRLLTMPLAEEAGGNHFHPGGRRWESQKDPEWQMLAAWVNGKS